MSDDEWDGYDQDTRDRVNVYLNSEERAALEKFKLITGVKADSQALKTGMLMAANVCHAFSGGLIKLVPLKMKKGEQRRWQDMK